ncbi:protein TolQ [Megalodesulfovibrio gigas]
MNEMGYLEILGQATLVVKLVIALLVVMSLTSWTIICTKIFMLKGAKRRAVRDMGAFQEARSLHLAIERMGLDSYSPAYRVAVEGVNELNRFEEYSSPDKGQVETVVENLRRALRHGVSNEVSRLTASLSFLATCASSAPFIGLFGTVWGIMHSFHSIGKQGAASLATVAPGISEALIATAIGLLVAIPAAIAYNYFNGLISHLEAELVNFAGVFLNRVQRELPSMAQA